MKSTTAMMKKIICAALAASALAACTPTTATLGNTIEDFQLAEVRPGTHTRSDVLRAFGSPTTVAPFDDNTWYYIGQQVEKHGIFDPEVVAERIIVVKFDEQGTVRAVEESDTGRLDIPLVERETPTHGNEVTFMQQFLGNIGRFNPPE